MNGERGSAGVPGLPIVLSSGFAGFGAASFVAASLEQLADRLRVDTVVLLVADPTETHLVAVAARGLEEEVLQGFQLPIGVGFAGRISSERRPLVVDDVRPGTVVNPLIAARGVRSMAGVPLVARDALIGVLHVGSLVPRHFGDEDLAVLDAAGAELAEKLDVERALADGTAARVLQRSLVPAAPPPIDGLEMATRFIPASSSAVGGDWYDVFPLPDRRVGVVMGDVTGSGLRAAVVMGRLRSALRAYALESSLPGETLDRLNRKLLHFEPSEMATVLFMTISADRDVVNVASAGHLGPTIAVPGSPGRLVDCEPNPPIGVPYSRPTPTCDTELLTGAILACCTDGLFERRRRSLDDQLDRLCAAVRAAAPETVCNEVMMTMVGTEHLEDDTALLVVRRT